MQNALNFITNHPILFSTIFALTNIAWLVFSFYQKHRNDKKLIDYKTEKDKELETVKFNFQIDLERKKKNFGIKQEVYEEFFNNLDNFQKKSQIDYQNEIHTAMQEFFTQFIEADLNKNKNRMAEVASTFHSNIHQLFLKIQEEVNILNNQNNRLKFLAPEEIRIKLKEITDGYQELFNLTNLYIKNISEMFFDKTQSEVVTEQFNSNIQPINLKLQKDMREIEELLRNDLFS